MEKNLYTRGFLSQLLQVDPRKLESQLDEAGIRPEFCINGLAQWGPDALTYLRSVAPRMQAIAELQAAGRKNAEGQDLHLPAVNVKIGGEQ